MVKTGHLGIVVHDIDKMLEFWVDTLGFKLDADFDFENDFLDTVQNLNCTVRLRIVKILDKDGFMIEFLLYKTHPTEVQQNNLLCNSGIRHVAFTVDDVQTYYEKLMEKGYKPLSTPQYSKELGNKLFFVRDPENNLVELVEIMS